MFTLYISHSLVVSTFVSTVATKIEELFYPGHGRNLQSCKTDEPKKKTEMIGNAMERREK
jgi:hypothetical protein